jgi:hypothetical protein
MRSSLLPFIVLGLLAVFPTGTQALTEAPRKLAEPWAGYWWPCYDGDGVDFHLWEGGNYNGTPGPIYHHDTRYFWLPEAIRDSAQAWEYDLDNSHRTFSPLLLASGHCNAVTCAQIKEPAPPLGLWVAQPG